MPSILNKKKINSDTPNTLVHGEIGFTQNFIWYGNQANTAVQVPRFSDLPTKTTLGLENVTNESKATMFASPTFTGTVSGVTATHVGLGSVTNHAQVKKLATSTNLRVPTWNGTTGDALNDGYLVENSSSPTALGTNANLVTEQDVYYGLVAVNNASQIRSTTIYAPTAGGTAGNILIANGATSAPSWGTTMTSIITAQNNTSYTTKQIRNITLSTADASGGANGDIWIKYIA
jgi:hypothetical protein